MVDSASTGVLANASVQVVGTQVGTYTRNDGGFLLPAVPAGQQRLRIARIGYTAKEVTVTVTANGQAAVEVALSAIASQLTAVVTTGYGQQRKEAITGAVATVKGDDANVGVQPNATGLLTGRVAGVNVIANNGEPGGGAQIRIRGGTSISASNDPLYVIDGVPIQNDQTEASGIGIGGGAALARNPLNMLNPNDIANITVLKDASATAIYGSRGANGVVLIETKRGSAGVSSMEYETFVAASSPSNTLDVLSGSEYRTFVQQQVTAGKLAASALTNLGTSNTDWEKELMRSSSTVNHNLSFSGGTSTTQYRASLNYLDQNGVVVSNGFRRFQGRLNATHAALDGKLRVNFNMTSSKVDNDYLPFENTGGFEGGVFTNMVIFNPTRPITTTTDGVTSFYEIGPGRQSVRNPVAIAEQVADVATTNRTLGNIQATYSLTDYLTASVNVGSDRTSGVRKTYFPRASAVGAEWNGRARQVNRGLSNNTLQSLLTFAPRLSDTQELEVVGGYEYSDFDNGEFGAEGRNYLTDAFSFNNLGGGGTLIAPFSFREQSRLVSFFGKANYSFKDRYFLTGVIRRDGSSRFGEGNKWAVFPAVSVGWKISDEGFMQGKGFSNLRLRAGYGLQGNQAVSPYASLILLEPNNGARYPFGDVVTTGVVPTRNENPNLKWEQTAQYNVAAEFGFKDNKYTGTLEYYRKNTEDLLLTVAVPQPALVPTRLENVGSLHNTGIEFSFDANLIEKKNLTYTTGIVASIERNEVDDLGGQTFIRTSGISGQGQSGNTAQRLIPGQPLGTFWGPEFVNVNAEGKQVFNNYKVTRTNGAVTSRTLDGTTTAPDADDFGIIGNANPAFSLGWRGNLRWNKWDMSYLWRGEFGRDVFNNTALVYSTQSAVLQGRNFLKSALDQKDGITEPAIYSSRWIEDGSFFRLQNVTVGYTFKIPGTRSNTARFYVSGDNLLLFTPYSGYDPEVFVDAGLASRGVDYLVYPRARTFTSGLRVQF
ncbi:SusC/RagA family TonB-linked outer membrane protein [Gemmatimonas phototrophica]|uniref:SusC/RagA family TonB-linked outer membrane protein n=1 Tax=Gemmatimonas phototrophica TaxID=1379270 RepID=UPI001314F050|nr:SusC/RagA family TonB-linked outer membrane protein [Gemmatimonas phototrophica]